MNRIIAIFVLVVCVAVAGAQPGRALKDIDGELRQAKSAHTIRELVSALGDAMPQSEEDVAILGRLMEKYPSQGQKALAGMKDPKLAKAVMKEADRQLGRFKDVKGEDWSKLPEQRRDETLNAFLNTQALFATLGRLKNKEALPYLKRFITPEYDGTLSYTASQAIGMIAPDDPAALEDMMAEVGKTKEIDLSVFGDKAFVKIIKELDEPGVSSERKFGLIEQIKGGRSPERKKALKELALRHKDEDVRNRSAQALLNSMLVNPEESDNDFIYEWLPRAVTELNAGWSLTALRTRFPDKQKKIETRFFPILTRILREGKYPSTRLESAQILGLDKTKESLPHLEECLLKDSDSGVRGACRHAYWQITGKVPSKFHPADGKELYDYYWSPRIQLALSKIKDPDPVKAYSMSIMKALEEYKRNKK